MRIPFLTVLLFLTFCEIVLLDARFVMGRRLGFRTIFCILLPLILCCCAHIDRGIDGIGLLACVLVALAIAYCGAKAVFGDGTINRLRHLFLVSTFIGLVWSSLSLFVSLELLCAVGTIDTVNIFCIITGIFLTYVGTHAFVETRSASNPYFFSRVWKDQASFAYGFSGKVTEKSALIRSLITPSALMKRVSERISPEIGSYVVRTDIEYRLPPALLTKESITVPVLFLGKCELTRKLVVSSKEGYRCRRLTEAQLVEKLAPELNQYFKECGYPELSNSEHFCRQMLRFDRYETDDRFLIDSIDCICEAFEIDSREALEDFQEQSASNKHAVLALKSLLESYRFAKPVCFELSRCGTGEFNETLLVNVERAVPQVLLRERANTALGRAFLNLKRILTKKRMHYYFGLGMADCCESYHLTFNGLRDCYLAGMGLNPIGLGRDLFIADEMIVSNRYDQQFSRLYIHEGRGFSGAALELSYEKRNHKPIATLLFNATLCLLVMLYIFFVSGLCPVPNLFAIIEGIDFNVSELFRLITILSVGNLISIWQAMEDYYAEEWLWMGVGSVVVASILFLVLGLVYFASGLWAEFIRVAWELLICVVYFTSIGSIFALYGKIKQHGNIMHKVPVARSISDEFEYTLTSEDLFVHYSDSLKNGSTDPYFDQVFSSNEPEGDFRTYVRGRALEYDMGIYFYRPLIGPNWKDGWLFPVWASSVNPFHQGSTSFIKSALGKEADDGDA